MKQLKKIMLIGGALSLCTTVFADTSTSSSAQNGGANPMMKQKKMMMQKMKSGPFSDMTDEQQKKIKDVVSAMRPKMEATLKQLREGRKKMSRFILDPKFDDGAVQAYADSQGKLYAQMLYMRLKMRHEIYQAMTPEQQAEIQKRMKQNENMMKNKMNVNTPAQ